MPPRLRPTTVNSLNLQAPSHFTSASHFLTTRQFSSTPQHATRLRRHMWAWLNGPGKAFKDPLPNSTNYLGAYDREGNLNRMKRSLGSAKDGEENEANASAESAQDPESEELRAEDEEEAFEKKPEERELPKEQPRDFKPFPLNAWFTSQPVLSEDLRDLIYKRVVEDGESVVNVSSQLEVSMERIAAVIRLKEVEKKWIEKGNSLALPYAKAVLEMLPTTPAPSNAFRNAKTRTPHESINDLPVHRATRPQLFHPVPESRHFTREDAAKAFHPNLLPADQRIPHPELILQEKARLAGLSRYEVTSAVQQFVQSEETKRREIKDRERNSKARHSKIVEGRRWDFVFEDCSVEAVGKDGRNKRGVGWRYGVPHQDRKKGQVKIPTSVEV